MKEAINKHINSTMICLPPVKIRHYAWHWQCSDEYKALAPLLEETLTGEGNGQNHQQTKETSGAKPA